MKPRAMNKSKCKSKPKILTSHLAGVTREICKQLYIANGATKVYDYANKIKLHYNHCKQCEALTPTIRDRSNTTCAICGGNKTIIIES